MAIYKKGDLILDEANVGAKTAEDWASQGFSLYNAPTTAQNDLYIGATNWSNLQKQYTPYQLEQATTRNDGGIYWNPSVNIKDIPAQLPASTLGEGANIENVPEPEPTTSIEGLMAATEPTASGLESLLKETQAQLKSQPKKDAYNQRLEEFSEQEKTAGRDLQEEMWSRFGLNQNVEQLQKLMPQMAALQASFDKGIMAQEGRTASASSIYGRQALMRRQQAVEMAGLGAMAQAYQGNIDMARTLSQDAINAKYADQEMYINNLRQQINYIEQDLNREEQVKMNQLELVINERERNIAEAKELETNLADIMMFAAQMGADQATLKKITEAQSYTDAIMLAQPYLKQKLSLPEQLSLIEGGYKLDAEGNVVVDTSSANVDQIANAIKQIESNNNYEAKGASGEYGAYQFMPGTWNSWSSEYAKNVLQISTRRLEPTPENQDAVAKYKIGQWLQQGLSPEQIAAKWNSGSEVGWENKIGVNKQGVAYNVPNYVKKFTSALSSQLGAGIIGEADAFTMLKASTIVTQISPRLANNKELIAQVADLIAKGTPIDDIEDELRYLSQSEKFEPWRNVANTAFSGVKMAVSERTRQLDIVDDYIASGDNAGAMEHIKTTILGSVGATEKKNVTGRDDALTSISVIEELIAEFEAQGGNTGLLVGKVEDFNKNVLKRTKNESLAYIANEIAMAIQKYRQDLTGAAFTESEAKEYQRIFPSIGKSPTLNRALISSLKSQYERNQMKFWERQLGGVANYNKLQELAGSPIVGTGDLSRFNTSNNTNQTQQWLAQFGY